MVGGSHSKKLVILAGVLFVGGMIVGTVDAVT